MFVLFLVTITSFLALVCIYEQFRTRRLRHMIKDIPTITSYPLVGSALEFGRDSVDYFRKLMDISKQLGTVFYLWMGPTLYVALSDAKDVEVILSSSTHLQKSSIYVYLKDWLGLGLITSPASTWRHHRKILTPAFHFKILESYTDVFSSNSKIMIKLLEKELGKERFDIGPYIDKCTLDIICETAMATSIHAQLNEESKFPVSLKVVSNAILARAFQPWLFPNFSFRMSPLGRKCYKHLEYINNFIDNVIVQKKKAINENKKVGLSEDYPVAENDLNIGYKKRFVFLDLLLLYAEDPKTRLTDKDIRDEVNTFMFAGHDTTSSTIGFAVHLLGKHPEVQEKILEELNTVLRESDRDPTYQDLMNLKYLEQVIRETLRLYPAVPYIGRTVLEDVKIPSGHVIPAGAEVVLLIHRIHRDPTVFPDPERFNPDNFSPENLSGRFAFSHVPFSAGPRNCIGQKFAMLEMKATLARLVQAYKITSVSPEPILAAELILRSVTGLNVRLEKRN